MNENENANEYEPSFEPQGDEYQFNENPEQEPFAAEALTPSTRASIINRKTILIILGVIVIGLSLYKLLSVFFAREAKVTAPTTQTQLPPQPVVQTPMPAATQPVQQSDNDYSDELSAIQANATQNNNQISSMQTQLNTLASSVSAIQSNMSAITTQLQAIASSLQQQQTQIASLMPKAKPAPAVVKKYVPSTPKTYFAVQAIVPGRAWLIAPDGSTVTVAIGDKLAGYGRITAINPLRGTVSTSSGAIIKYKGG